MKRRSLIQHLKRHGCYFIREGGSHSIWGRSEDGVKAAIPRHTEISNRLAKDICKQLRIPPPQSDWHTTSVKVILAVYRAVGSEHYIARHNGYHIAK